MIPVQYIPFGDQMGMSERLHGARRSTLREGLAHALRKHVLTDDHFKAAIDQYREGLGALLSGAPRRDDEQLPALLHALGLVDLTTEPGRDAKPAQRADDAISEPLASMLALVLHVVANAVAESAFVADEPDDEEDEESRPEFSDGSNAGLGKAPVNDLMGIAPDAFLHRALGVAFAEVGAMADRPRGNGATLLTIAFLQDRLASALNQAAQFNFYRQHRAQGQPGSSEYPIQRETCKLLAQILLEALPDALTPKHPLAEIESPLSWSAPVNIAGKTQKLLKLSDTLSAALANYLRDLPLTLTLQPLIRPSSFDASTAPAANRTAIPDHRRLPLFRYNHWNQPLRDFVRAAVLDADFKSTVKAIEVQQRVAWRLNARILNCARKLLEFAPGERAAAVPGSLTAEQSAEWRDWVAVNFFGIRHGRRQNILPGEFLRNPLVHSVLNDAFAADGTPVPFYLPWKADYRGRIYAETPWFTPQGGDLQRALFEFARGTSLNSNGWKALKQYGAGLVSRDIVLSDLNIQDRKVLTLVEREAWVDLHEEQILACAADPLTERFWCQHSSKPWQFLAFCFAYADAKANPGAPCHTPVQIDGTCNGLQHIAALIGNRELAQAVNVGASTPGDIPSDIYGRIAEQSRAELGDWAGRLAKDVDSAALVLHCLLRYPQTFSAEVVQAIVERKATASTPFIQTACEAAQNELRRKANPGKRALADIPKTLTRLIRESLKAATNASARDPEAIAADAFRRCQAERDRIRLDSLGSLLLAARPGLLNRTAAKAVVMTIPYGASPGTQAHKIVNDALTADLALSEDERSSVRACWILRYPDRQAIVTDEDLEQFARRLLATEMVALLNRSLLQLYPVVSEFTQYLKSLARAAARRPILWRSPVGMPICQDGFLRDEKKSKSLTLATNRRVEIRYVQLLDEVDPAAQQRKLLPHLVHSLDASHLLMSLNAAADAGIDRIGSIHDCVLVHPNEAQAMGGVLREQFARLHEQVNGPGTRSTFMTHWTRWIHKLSAIARYPHVDRLSLVLLDRLEAQMTAPSVTEADRRRIRHYLTEKNIPSNRKSIDDPEARELLDALEPMSPTELVWLHFASRWKAKSQSEKPAPVFSESSPPVPSADFDIELVLQSSYFFS